VGNNALEGRKQIGDLVGSRHPAEVWSLKCLTGVEINAEAVGILAFHGEYRGEAIAGIMAPYGAYENHGSSCRCILGRGVARVMRRTTLVGARNF